MKPKARRREGNSEEKQNEEEKTTQLRPNSTSSLGKKMKKSKRCLNQLEPKEPDQLKRNNPPREANKLLTKRMEEKKRKDHQLG